jgi:hypothetical protein
MALNIRNNLSIKPLQKDPNREGRVMQWTRHTSSITQKQRALQNRAKGALAWELPSAVLINKDTKNLKMAGNPGRFLSEAFQPAFFRRK